MHKRQNLEAAYAVSRRRADIDHPGMIRPDPSNTLKLCPPETSDAGERAHDTRDNRRTTRIPCDHSSSGAILDVHQKGMLSFRVFDDDHVAFTGDRIRSERYLRTIRTSDKGARPCRRRVPSEETGSGSLPETDETTFSSGRRDGVFGENTERPPLALLDGDKDMDGIDGRRADRSGNSPFRGGERRPSARRGDGNDRSNVRRRSAFRKLHNRVGACGAWNQGALRQGIRGAKCRVQNGRQQKDYERKPHFRTPLYGIGKNQTDQILPRA